MKKRWRIVIGVVLVGFLVLVRQTENKLFYDPFMAFFGGSLPAKETAPIELYFNLALRFFLNSLISLGVLYCCFPKKNVVKFSSWLYLLFFAILFPLFVFLMGQVTFENYLPVFYVRRFLAHPVLLLVLIPAFFYQKLKIKR